MSDKEFDDLMVACHIEKRRGVIRSLLAGNDTLCFTTQQYADKMFEKLIDMAKDQKSFWEYWFPMARKQLDSERMREVSPDVWTLPG